MIDVDIKSIYEEADIVFVKDDGFYRIVKYADGIVGTITTQTGLFQYLLHKKCKVIVLSVDMSNLLLRNF